MIDWSSCPAVERDPDRVSGAWVFRGTRVPVAALFENLEDGEAVPLLQAFSRLSSGDPRVPGGTRLALFVVGVRRPCRRAARINEIQRTRPCVGAKRVHDHS